MTERSVIEERLRKKQAEIVTLEEKLKAAKVYVAALQDIMRLLGEPKGTEDDGVDAKLRPGSAVAQARDVILARGEPAHIDDLLSAMGKDVTRDSKASLAGSIAAYVRRGEIFSRPAPNTFGLIELGHTDVSVEDAIEPPAGFGSGGGNFRGGFRDELDDVPF